MMQELEYSSSGSVEVLQTEVQAHNKVPADHEEQDEVTFDFMSEREDIYGPHIRLLTLNTYLIPPLITWTPHLWIPFWTCRRSFERATHIGNLASRYDLVCLQEVWGTNLSGLNDAVYKTHGILPETQACSGSTLINEAIGPLCLYLSNTGGQWFAWRQSKFDYLSVERYPFPLLARVPFSNQNVTVLKLDVNRVFPGKKLLVFGTHFSLFEDLARTSNLECLRKFILENIAAYSPNYWPSQEDENGPGPVINLKELAVLLCGDFNLDRVHDQASYIWLKTLGGNGKLRDLYEEEENPNYLHQLTYFSQENLQEDSNGCKKGNSMFPWPFSGRIDHVFAVDEIYVPWEFVEQRMKEQTLCDTSNADVEEVQQNGKQSGFTAEFEQIYSLGTDIIVQHPGSELSDHWPLSCRFCIGPPTVDIKKLPIPKKQDLNPQIKYPSEVQNCSDYLWKCLDFMKSPCISWESKTSGAEKKPSTDSPDQDIDDATPGSSGASSSSEEITATIEKPRSPSGKLYYESPAQDVRPTLSKPGRITLQTQPRAGCLQPAGRELPSESYNQAAQPTDSQPKKGPTRDLSTISTKSVATPQYPGSNTIYKATEASQKLTLSPNEISRRAKGYNAKAYKARAPSAEAPKAKRLSLAARRAARA